MISRADIAVPKRRLLDSRSRLCAYIDRTDELTMIGHPTVLPTSPADLHHFPNSLIHPQILKSLDKTPGARPVYDFRLGSLSL